MSKAVDDILGFLRTESLSDEDQAELIQRLRDGEADKAKPAGQWVSALPSPALVGRKFDAEQAGFNVDWVHGPDVPQTHGLVVTFYHGQMDGKPVIQIDGEADFRINVNDCPVWDQRTGLDYVMPEELKGGVKCAHCGMPHRSSYCEEDRPALKQREMVWVGTIKDIDGIWVYVGATKQALYADMRSNYGLVEYREESDHDWVKRVQDTGALIHTDSYYVEGAE